MKAADTKKESTKSMPLKNKAMNILFDLDGTITDPMLGITNSVMYALKRYGIVVEDRRELYKFIGPPLAESFSRYYGFSESEGHELVKVYREYFSDKGLYENEVYEGIEDMLKTLKGEGHKIYLATSKPQVYAKRILQHFLLDKYFDGIVGSELNGDRVEKSAVITYLLGKYSLADAIMVGDRCFDIMGAKENGLASIGVLYGYGEKDELKNVGADFLAESVEDLKKILLNLGR